jgi:hypothetical protein
MRLGAPDPKYSIDALAILFSMFGYRFVPLVTLDLELLCNIEILFLRFGNPGGVINRVGDIDNRLKTLFDALSMPRDANQLGSFTTQDKMRIQSFACWKMIQLSPRHPWRAIPYWSRLAIRPMKTTHALL